MGSRTHLKTTLTLSFTFLNTSASTFQPSLHRLWFSNDASCQRASEVCVSHGPTLDVHCSRRGPPHQAEYIFRHAFPLQTWSHVACFWPAVSSGKLNSGAVQMVSSKNHQMDALPKANGSSVKAILFLSNKKQVTSPSNILTKRNAMQESSQVHLQKFNCSQRLMA